MTRILFTFKLICKRSRPVAKGSLLGSICTLSIGIISLLIDVGFVKELIALFSDLHDPP